MVVSIGLQEYSFVLACIYHPPTSCTINFLKSSYYIYGDFNIHVDVPDGDGFKFMTFLDSCDLKQETVSQPTHLHGHILHLILSPSDQDAIRDVKIGDFLSDHA